MKVRKTTLILPVAGLLAGLGLSYLVPARYSAAAIVALSETSTEAGVPEIHRALAEFFSANISELLSDASLSMLIQDPRVGIYQSQRDHVSVESAIAKTRDAIRIDVADSPSPAQSTYRISYTGGAEDQATKMVNAMITRLIQGHTSAFRTLANEQDKALQAQIAELKARLAALEDRAGVKPALPVRPAATHDISPEWTAMMNAGPAPRITREQVVFEVLEAPTAEKVFPIPFVFTIGGATLGVIAAIFVSLVR